MNQLLASHCGWQTPYKNGVERESVHKWALYRVILNSNNRKEVSLEVTDEGTMHILRRRITKRHQEVVPGCYEGPSVSALWVPNSAVDLGRVNWCGRGSREWFCIVSLWAPLSGPPSNLAGSHEITKKILLTLKTASENSKSPVCPPFFPEHVTSLVSDKKEFLLL